MAVRNAAKSNVFFKGSTNRAFQLKIFGYKLYGLLINKNSFKGHKRYAET